MTGVPLKTTVFLKVGRFLKACKMFVLVKIVQMHNLWILPPAELTMISLKGSGSGKYLNNF